MMRVLMTAIVSATYLFAQKSVERPWSILEDGVKNESIVTRVKAIRALGLITGNARAVQLAEWALGDNNDPAMRVAGAEALGQMGAKSSAPKLIAAAKATDTSVVFAAASSLYMLGHPAAYEVYYAVLLGERKSGATLVESQMKMVKDPKAMARMGFEQGLGFIPFAGVGYSVFKTVTKDDSSPVRAAAAQKLIRDPDSKTADALMKAASDAKWLVRASVVDAIAKRGDPALLKAVWPLLDDENETVRFVAAATIVRLTK